MIVPIADSIKHFLPFLANLSPGKEAVIFGTAKHSYSSLTFEGEWGVYPVHTFRVCCTVKYSTHWHLSLTFDGDEENLLAL
jgi:hypothetical protein